MNKNVTLLLGCIALVAIVAFISNNIENRKLDLHETQLEIEHEKVRPRKV